MPSGLRRYEFGEQLARILGESRRDLRFRVTMMVSGGVVEPGPRGRGSPLATPDYGANLLIGTMAAPQQVHTVEAIRCYRELAPVAIPEATAPGIVVGAPTTNVLGDTPENTSTRSLFSPAPSSALSSALPLERLRFGECLTGLLEFALLDTTREILANELFGIWVNRGCPVAALQIGTWSGGRRDIITQRFELPKGENLPAWLDPDRGGIADPGLFHTVFLPVGKLIEIGMLTTSQEKKGISMLNPSLKITKLAELVDLVRQGRYRPEWEKFLSALAQVQAWTSKVDTRDSRLVEVTDFGSNPGNLRMFTYVPRDLPAGAPLVVALHGCTQTAAAYDEGAGWSQLADRFGFSLLLPQQHWSNNPLRCFNWFRPEDTARDGGEPLSIRQMIGRMLADHGLDGRAVYVTGLSSGAAMTSVMLATYPDLFAGGAIIAGVPYHAADGLQGAFEAMFTGQTLPQREWGDRVRAASSHQGPWPKVSVWHGDADTAVTPANAEETIKQWVDVHGISPAHAMEDRIDGYPRRAWQNAQGEVLVESYTITGMSHGQPLDTAGDTHSCGTAAPFFNDVGISSAYRIAEFWGLPEVARAEGEPSVVVERPGEQSFEVVPMAAASASDGAYSSSQRTASSTASSDEIHGDGAANTEGMGTGNPYAKSGTAPFGIDVQGIISKSLGMAGGILKDAGLGAGGPASTGSKSGSGDVFGIDVQGIVDKSLEMAGALAEAHKTSQTDEEGKSRWQGEGWELIPHSSRASSSALSDEPLLFGYASSGNDCDMGSKVRSISRQVLLGPHPSLSYIRRLHLNAAVNEYTKARFSVLVDGLPVDEVSATGMKHAETEWTQRSNIDLAPFADRTVTLTFEVSAHSNVCNEVSAKAWVDRVHVRDVVTVTEA
uniref:Esterase, PHB depolymerase family n=1 Tax=Candidatus Kentrum sp. LFY TaxID=2126342 RepID=A0A450URG9_9GAMM|nr:MAG: esterase, PHB depolymerase family [Candidatus Kentron sp. LFY]